LARLSEHEKRGNREGEHQRQLYAVGFHWIGLEEADRHDHDPESDAGLKKSAVGTDEQKRRQLEDPKEPGGESFRGFFADSSQQDSAHDEEQEPEHALQALGIELGGEVSAEQSSDRERRKHCSEQSSIERRAAEVARCCDQSLQDHGDPIRPVREPERQPCRHEQRQDQKRAPACQHVDDPRNKTCGDEEPLPKRRESHSS
jgi:hypothetical protein